jgi:hypothetical protein
VGESEGFEVRWFRSAGWVELRSIPGLTLSFEAEAWVERSKVEILGPLPW